MDASQIGCAEYPKLQPDTRRDPLAAPWSGRGPPRRQPSDQLYLSIRLALQEKRASAAAEVGPDGRDGGRGGLRAAASKMGDTGKAVRKCIELPVIDRNAG